MDNELFASLEKQAKKKTGNRLFINKILFKIRFVFTVIRINRKLFIVTVLNLFFVVMGIIYTLKLLF